MHQQVAHPGGGQVALQRLPMAAVVEGYEYALVGAGIEQARALRIGAYHG